MRSLHTFVHTFHRPDAAILLVRIAVGIVFLVHGWQKLSAIDPVIQFFGMIGLAPFWAYVVATVEVVGGLAVLLGVFTRYGAALLAAVSLVALFKVHLANGFFIGNGGYEFVLVLFLASTALFLSGSGGYSAMHRARLKCGDMLCGTCEVK